MKDGRIRLKVRDEETNNLVFLDSTTALKANQEFNIAFTIAGHVGSKGYKDKPGCKKQFTYLKNVTRLYVYPSGASSVPGPQADNGADIDNVKVSGYDNPVYLGNSASETLPFLGKLTMVGAHSLALNQIQLKTLSDSVPTK